MNYTFVLNKSLQLQFNILYKHLFEQNINKIELNNIFIKVFLLNINEYHQYKMKNTELKFKSDACIIK